MGAGPGTDTESLEQFFDRYRTATERLTDVAELDPFFGLPWMVITPDGSVACYHTMEEVRSFTQTRFDMFWKDKLVHWQRRSYDIITLGPAATVVSINWEVRQDDGPMMRAWRHYYTVVRGPQGWKIVNALFQA